MRGLEDSLGVKTQDIAWVLDGHIPEHYQVTNLIYQIFIIMFIWLDIVNLLYICKPVI